MSASLRLRVGVVAAGLSCLLLSYAIAQQVQTSGQTRSDQSRTSASSAAGQTDRSTTQQSDRSTPRRGEQTYGESAQSRTANFRGATAAAGGQNQAVDQFLAACLLAKNQGEVQLSELAQQKAENPDVKEFAQKMVQDHRKMIEQLQPLAGMQGSTNRGVSGTSSTRTETQRSTTSDTSATRRTSESATRTSDTTALPGSSGAGQATAPSGTTAAAPPTGANIDTTSSSVATTDRASAGSGAVHQLMQIDRQINDRCLQAHKQELQQKSGAEFDKAFVGTAIVAHIGAIAALEVIGQQTQGQLAQVAQQAQPTVQQHLDHAKQLMKQLEGNSSAAGSQAERRSTRTE